MPLVAWHRPGKATPALPAGVTWQPIDLLDKTSVAAALGGMRPARIYHIAGASRLDTSWQNVVPHLETNVLGTHHVLDAVRSIGAPCRVVVVTSAMVYQVSDVAIDEHTPFFPASPYGVSKLAQDQLALRAAQQDGMDVVIARPFNHVGPRQDPGFSVSSFARQIALVEAGRAEPVIHVGNLEARRDLSDVRDVAEAYERLMDGGRGGRAYNICTGRAVRMGDVLDELIRQSPVRVRVVFDSERLRPNDMPLFIGNPARMRDELDWVPQHPLVDTLRDTLDWWRHQVVSQVN